MVKEQRRLQELLFMIAQVSKTISPASATNLVQPPNLFQAIIFGLVQGLTEFLPISSTAHLKVIPVGLGWGDPGVTFTAVIQLGSIIAVLWYFWHDLTQITKGAFKAVMQSDYDSQNLHLAIGITLGTIPIGLLGLLVKLSLPDFDNSPLRSLAAIAITSIVMGLLLGLAERFGRGKRGVDALNVWGGIWMGLAQAMALIPGVSRAGSTLTAGLIAGIEQAAAARFSFLLGIQPLPWQI